ncbi:MAG: DUF6036 family nucleotidyltransferase [Solirubrobacteraceae bacterium]
MADAPQIDADRAYTLLGALGEQLALRSEKFTIAVVGGSALLALGLVSRATRDVDVVAVLYGEELVSAEPLPAVLLEAVGVVAADFGLASDWLNAGPASMLEMGLPEGFLARVQHRRYGPALTVLFASRLDQIHFKLYAVVDLGTGRHLADLQALAPTAAELLGAARWTRTHDPSEGYLAVLLQVLDHFGVEHGPDDV